MFRFLICFIAGLGAGLGTGFAGMSAAAVISPMLITFLGLPSAADDRLDDPLPAIDFVHGFFRRHYRSDYEFDP